MKLIFGLLFFMSGVAFAKPYDCTVVSFGETPQKVLGSFSVEPNGGKAQEIVVSNPDPARIYCYGQPTSDSLRLVCVVGDYSTPKIAPTASVKDGSALMTLVAPVGKNNYAIACVGSWTNLNSTLEAQALTK